MLHMAHYVVWLDSEKAHIFDFTVKGVTKSHLEKKLNDHHTHNKKDHHHDGAQDHFFQNLANMIKSAEEILIMGPGLAKNHFKTHLEKQDLGKRVIGVENSDHPTDNQIVAAAKKFYHKYNLFNNPVN